MSVFQLQYSHKYLIFPRAAANMMQAFQTECYNRLKIPAPQPSVSVRQPPMNVTRNRSDRTNTMMTNLASASKLLTYHTSYQFSDELC